MSDYHMNESARGKGTAISRSAIQGLAIIALAMVLTACVAPRPGADLPPYGDSVRHTKEIQAYEPGDAIPPTHGAKAAEAMRTYRLPASGVARQAPGAMQ